MYSPLKGLNSSGKGSCSVCLPGLPNLSSLGRVLLQRGFPPSFSEHFQSFKCELSLWILLLLKMRTFLGANMASVKNKNKTSACVGK